MLHFRKNCFPCKSYTKPITIVLMMCILVSCHNSQVENTVETLLLTKEIPGQIQVLPGLINFPEATNWLHLCEALERVEAHPGKVSYSEFSGSSICFKFWQYGVEVLQLKSKVKVEVDTAGKF